MQSDKNNRRMEGSAGSAAISTVLLGISIIMLPKRRAEGNKATGMDGKNAARRKVETAETTGGRGGPERLELGRSWTPDQQTNGQAPTGRERLGGFRLGGGVGRSGTQCHRGQTVWLSMVSYGAHHGQQGGSWGGAQTKERRKGWPALYPLT